MCHQIRMVVNNRPTIHRLKDEKTQIIDFTKLFVSQLPKKWKEALVSVLIQTIKDMLFGSKNYVVLKMFLELTFFV